MRGFGRVRGWPAATLILLALSLTLAPSLALAQPANIWIPTGILTTGRSTQTATLLPNGHVLVAGGQDSSGNPLVSAELYDPAAGTWTATGPLTTWRRSHTATLLPNGQVLVAGGWNTTYLASAELYDPGTGQWTATGSLATARDGTTATLLVTGKVLVAGGAGGSGALASCELYDPAAGSWSPAGSAPLYGSLNEARSMLTATLMPNGQVLVAGGFSPTLLPSAELYDPATGNWSMTSGPVIDSRYHHTATLLPTGQVLVAGGYYYDYGTNTTRVRQSAELYNPGSGRWSTAGTPLSVGRAEHSATLLPNGQVVVAGGWNDQSGTLGSTEIYNPGTNNWQTLASLNSARLTHTATLLPSGQVLVAGGQDSNGNALASAELYYYAAGSWAAAGSLQTGRASHTATLLPNGKLLAAGGLIAGSYLASAELYDPTAGGGAGAWSATGSLQTSRAYHTATLLGNGKVLVHGGANSIGILASAELFDPASGNGKFTTISTLGTTRSQHTATLLANGQVLMAGGGGAGGFLASAELYDQATGLWSATGSFQTGRQYHTATLLPNGQVLLAGGTNGSYLSSAELYYPPTGTWTPTVSLKTSRAHHTATLLPNGKVLVAGGYGSGYLSSAELYDPATGLWSDTGSLITGRCYHTATLLPNGQVLVAGGYGNSGYAASAELYNPATGQWSATGILGTPCYWHTATLLSNGQVLLAGGYNSSYLANAELYDRGLGFTSTWRPQITSLYPQPLLPLSSLAVFGTGFRGVSGASGGSTNDSPTDFPLVQIRRLDNEWTLWLPPDPAFNFNATGFASRAFKDFQSGYALVTVFANGIPSASGFINFQTAQATAVELASFTATPATDRIVLAWQTYTESNNAGFQIWRAPAGTNTYTKISPFIPSMGTASMGAKYSYDDVNVALGQVYDYKLQDLDRNGTSTFHGPVTATLGYIKLLAPKDQAALSARRPAPFHWQSMPFNQFRLQFCHRADFKSRVVTLPLSANRRMAGTAERGWIREPAYIPTAQEWQEVRDLSPRGRPIYWRVFGEHGTGSTYTSAADSFSLY